MRNVQFYAISKSKDSRMKNFSCYWHFIIKKKLKFVTEFHLKSEFTLKEIKERWQPKTTLDLRDRDKQTASDITKGLEKNRAGKIMKWKGQNFRGKIFLGQHHLKRGLFFRKFQFSSVAQSSPTLRDPMNRSMPGLLVHHKLQQKPILTINENPGNYWSFSTFL